MTAMLSRQSDPLQSGSSRSQSFHCRLEPMSIMALSSHEVSRIRPRTRYLTPSEYMTAGQTFIMDQSVTQEQRDRVARPSTAKGSASGKGHNRRVSWNANTYLDKGRSKSKIPDEREHERGAVMCVRSPFAVLGLFACLFVFSLILSVLSFFVCFYVFLSVCLQAV